MTFCYQRISFILLFFWLSISFKILAQSSHQVDGYYPLLQKKFDRDRAYATVAFVEKRWRLAGNSGFNESIDYVEKILKEAGYKKEITSENDAPLTYRIEKRKMQHPTWEPMTAKVSLAGEAEPLLDFTSNRNMLAMYSASTVPEGVTAEVVYVGKGSAGDFENKNVSGKIVFAETGVSSIYKIAIDKGAVGVFAYSMPSYTQPTKHVHSIQFQSIPYSSADEQRWGILLSNEVREKLKARLAKGTVLATVVVESKIYPSEEFTLVANVRGASKPDERFVFSAHVQEPGANDNASGVGTLAEMARVTAQLVESKTFQPERTITFLWGDEIVSTGRYIKDDAKRAKGIKWGLSLDMVGEDVSRTGGSFLIEKMPDPSAIWTRGKEKHTEWGGSELKESQMFPHYFNDLLLNRCLQQARENNWVVNTNPFEGGSDHTPFLQANIPGLLMWHFTDVFYHTDADRIDKVSKDEMRNVGISALATAFTLCAADESTAIFLLDEIQENAIARLNTEFELSRKAMGNGSTLSKEQHILEVWTSWYVRAIGSMSDISVNGLTENGKDKIQEAQRKIEATSRALISKLKK